jgi:hypothetical protein
MNIFPPASLVSSLLAMLGLILGLKKSRVWLWFSALTGFLLLLHTHHRRCGQAHQRFGFRKTDEVEVATASLSQLRNKMADNSQSHAHSKENPGI